MCQVAYILLSPLQLGHFSLNRYTPYGYWLNSTLNTGIANIAVATVFHCHCHPHHIVTINILTIIITIITQVDGVSVQRKLPLGVSKHNTSFTRHVVSLRVIHNATAFLVESKANLTVSSALSLEQVNHTTDNTENSNPEVKCSRVLGNVWSC